MPPLHQPDGRVTSAPTETWDSAKCIDPRFRNKVWNDVLGSSRKRDVFLAVRELAEERACLEKTEIATKALAYPHFRDRDKLQGGDLGDNGDLEPLCELGAVMPIPKIARPSVAYIVPFQELCQYLVDPYHAPDSVRVRLAIEYYLRHRGRNGVSDVRSKCGRDLPIDPFAVELYTYVQLAEQLDVGIDRVEYSGFRPAAIDHDHARGFEIEGTLHGVEPDDGSEIDDAGVKRVLETLFVEFVDHAARGKDIFRIGMYRCDDESDTERAARRRAITDSATFEQYDRRGAAVTVSWQVEPVIMI
ncbi:hypothetical protein [Halopiger aswanensis]|uniref:Uncharacterized protein n=1 Tax=Halopiger aswanensis TaxID=148449 RepID=A0A419VVS9_9EURY|nr:hypothetical protein [Halopiger aswanensis]RKD86228.1 hypothetical protein ATJ93_4645 [Halopiger aswanensis]